MKTLNYKMTTVVIALVFMLIPVEGQAYDTQEEISQFPTELSEKMENYITLQMEEGGIPGLSVVIVKENETMYQQGFGYSDLGSNKEVVPSTLFEIGSNSKALTALGILKLEEEKHLQLSDSVSKYIPWLKMNYNGEKVEVTIEQFLNHTSGVPFSSINKIPISNDRRALEEAVRTLVDIELENNPGEQFEYASMNYNVLGLIIEYVTGRSFEDYMQDQILRPLRLNNTYLFETEELSAEMAKGYKLLLSKPFDYRAPVYRGNKPAGYFISNSIDMAKWLKYLNGYIDDNSFKELVQRSISDKEVAESKGELEYYNNGWVFSHDKVYHEGANPNYSSYVIFYPEEELGVAILSNIQSDYVYNIGEGIVDIVNGSTPNAKVTDFNKTVDTIALIVSAFLILVLFFILYTIIIIVKDIVRKKRSMKKLTVKSILQIIFSLGFMLFLSYCIYLIPGTFLGNLSWDFVIVWAPISLEITLYLFLLVIWFIYIRFVITSIVEQKDREMLFEFVLMSIFSGFGNALIIVVITQVIQQNAMLLNLFLYFLLGITLYVYGQKILRRRLVYFTNDMVYKKRLEIIDKLLKAQYYEYEKIEDGRIHATLNSDTERVSEFANVIVTATTSIVTLVFCSIYLGFISIIGLLFSIIIIILIASIYFIYGRHADKVWEEGRIVQNHFFRFINDLMKGYKELSINDKKKKEFNDDMKYTSNQYRVSLTKANIAFSDMFVVGELLFTIAIAGVVFLLPVASYEIDMDSLSTFVFVLLYMTGPVHGILNCIPDAIQVRIGWKHINGLINDLLYVNSDYPKDNDLDLPNKVQLKLENIEYEYPISEGAGFKIGPICYEFNPGEIIFITGGNGSGKSTLAKLITGLYTVSKGRILINGKPVSNKTLNQYYAAVFSDFHLFKKLYGVKANKKEVEKHLKTLQLDSKVEVNNNEFSSTNLSTGQRKRLALLVAYLEDKPIYLFDEWAADQDSEFRDFFYNELLPELKNRGKCVIAITHDEKYFSLADKRIHMNMGEIEEISLIK